ncbi:transcriptional regulator, DeoR family [Halobacillus dabanensis]|uniref:Transcriptional regulator, DeoR family n=1 Tax=Halobacillus dabanensis TaxID=240302 RepID=A0A1I3S2T3_HALDA|nr:transcriptional regulator, DeoR family [Halobacillus dabanensis]
MGKMFATERRNLIVSHLQQEKRLTVKHLANKLNVSEATLRTDLNLLEEEGLLTRTHGGAVLNENEPPKNNFSDRAMRNIDYKKSITRKAVELISRKDCILLDASTTSLELARIIKEKETKLTVVTNGISTALELKENPSINVILIGGIARMGSMGLEGLLGKNVLDEINIEMMFTSASGFTLEDGLSDFNVYEVELKKVMVQKAKKVIALLDHTKIGTSSIAPFASIDEIDKIITDEDIPNEILQLLKDSNIDIIN